MPPSRVIEFAASPAYLRLHLGQAVIERDGLPDATVPLEDIAVIVISHPQVVLSAALISEFLLLGGAVVFCNRVHMPCGLLLPTANHSTQQERFEAQAEASLPLKKRLWQQVVSAKILRQAELLFQLTGNDRGLKALSATVKSGDSGNAESLAAQRYWAHVFSHPSFRRRRDGDAPNPLLNYGYAVLRACVARSICAAGLHPSLGIHHCNRYDSYCLADDLMEPFRPLVDAVVASIVAEHGLNAPLDREAKTALLSVLTSRYTARGESRTLFDWLQSLAASLAQIFLGAKQPLDLPELSHVPPRKEPLRVQSHVDDGHVRSAG